MAETIGKGVLQVGFDQDQVEKAGKEQLLPSAKRIAGDIAGVFAAVKIGGFIKGGIDELKDAEAVSAQTKAALASTGNAAHVSADQVAELAGSLSDLSGHDDEAIQKGENLLLTFKGIRNEVGAGNDIFNQATAAALDLSQSGFGSIESASVLLGKALDDPIAGVTALQRVGVKLTDSQKETVKQLVETGDVLGAQKIILGEVESQVGGAAKAYGETLPGQLERARTAMDNAKASLVAGLAPALEAGSGLVVTLAEDFSKLPEPVQETIGAVALVGGGIASLARPVSDIIGLVDKLKVAHEAAAVAAAAQAVADEGLAVAEGEAAVASGVLTAALGPIGLIAAAAGAVFAIGSLIQGNHDVKKATTDYTQALQAQSGVLEQNIDDVSAHALALSPAAREAHDAGLAYGAMFVAIRDGGPVLDKFTGALKSSGGSVGVAVDYLHRAGAETDTFGKHLLDLLQSGKLNVDQVTALAEAVAGLSDKYRADKDVADATKEGLGAVGQVMDDTSGSSDALSVSLDDQAAALDAARAAAKNLADEYQSIVDGTISQFEAEIALSDARLRGRDAVAALDKARTESKISAEDGLKLTNDTFSAILNEAKAAEGYAQAQATARGETLSAKDAQQALIEELYAVASTLAPGSDLQIQLSDYITKLQGAPATVATTFVADTDAAVRAVQALQREIAGVTGDTEISFIPTRSGPQTRATGGPVAPLQRFEGAEEGPELLFKRGIYQAPPEGGFVMPAGASARWLESASVGAAGAFGGVRIDQVNVIGENAPDALHELPGVMRQTIGRVRTRA